MYRLYRLEEQSMKMIPVHVHDHVDETQYDQLVAQKDKLNVTGKHLVWLIFNKKIT